MDFHWHDLLGMVGVAGVLIAYLALQLGRMSSDSLAFSVWNGVGSLLIVWSLLYSFNLSAFVVEVFWVLISGIGVVRWWRRRDAVRGPS